MSPQIDHVVIDVQDQMQEAIRRYTALGFHVTRHRQQDQASFKRLAVLGAGYVELYGYGEEVPQTDRPQTGAWPVGLNGLAFAVEDTRALWASLQSKGLQVSPPASHHHPLAPTERRRVEAETGVLRLPDRSIFDGRLTFCEDRRPGPIHEPDRQAHANGAVAIARVLLSVEDPDRTTAAFERIFGPGSVEASEPGMRRLQAGEARIDMVQRELLERLMGDAIPDPAGRADHMVLLGLGVRSLQRARDVLRANGVQGIHADRHGLLVPPAEAMNVALEFSESR